MSEVIKMNLSKIAATLVIVVTLASAVGGGYIAYDNGKTTETDLKEFKSAQEAANKEVDRRLADSEKKQARFEGVIDERTRTTQNDVKELKCDMKLLLNKLELDREKD